MSAWIFRIIVSEKEKYYYELDRALEEIRNRTIYQYQGRIKSIDVGDIVYFYECDPISAICWKCKVLAVNVPYEKTYDIDDSEFEHGETEREGYYIKVVALAKYEEGKDRQKLSIDKLRENGLTQERSSFSLNSPRVNPQLLKYISSIKPSVEYND